MHCNSKRFWMFSFKDFRIRGFLLTSPFQDQPDSKRSDTLAVSATVGERELESSFSLLLKTHSNNLTRQKLLALDVKFWIFWHFSALELTRFLQFIEVSKLIKTGPRLTGSPIHFSKPKRLGTLTNCKIVKNPLFGPQLCETLKKEDFPLFMFSFTAPYTYLHATNVFLENNWP